MKNQKICMIGAFAVGKTSLVHRFVSSIFSDKYYTTIGVKISKKQVISSDESVQLMIWDIEGTDAFTELRTSYLRGAAGIVLVVDGTRKASLEEAAELRQKIIQVLGEIPLVTLLNKSDLVEQWVIDSEILAELHQQHWCPLKTSAKTGDGVDEAFLQLVDMITGNMRE